MNWDAVSSLAELVGAMAVVVSLVYLIRQIKLNSDLVQQNSRHIEGTIYHSTNSVFLNWHALIAGDREVAPIWMRFLGSDSLEPEERVRAHALVTMLFLSYEADFVQVGLGVSKRNSLDYPSFKLMLEREAVTNWWEKNGQRIFTQEFREAVDTVKNRLQRDALVKSKSTAAA